jgi:GNAT superfamily N-acetyltransferase
MIQPPADSSRAPAKGRAAVAIVLVFLAFAALLLALGQELEIALAAAGTICLVGGRVAYLVLGSTADRFATVVLVVAVVLFAVLLLWRGQDLASALLASAAAALAAAEVAARILTDPAGTDD